MKVLAAALAAAALGVVPAASQLSAEDINMEGTDLSAAIDAADALEAMAMEPSAPALPQENGLRDMHTECSAWANEGKCDSEPDLAAECALSCAAKVAAQPAAEEAAAAEEGSLEGSCSAADMAEGRCGWPTDSGAAADTAAEEQEVHRLARAAEGDDRQEPPATTLPPDEPPATSLPPDEPPATTFPPEEPPVTTFPPEEPPATTFPPAEPPLATTFPPAEPPLATTFPPSTSQAPAAPTDYSEPPHRVPTRAEPMQTPPPPKPREQPPRAEPAQTPPPQKPREEPPRARSPPGTSGSSGQGGSQGRWDHAQSSDDATRKRFVAMYSIAQVMGRWLSAVAVELGFALTKTAFAEPPLNGIVGIFGTMLAIMAFFRALPTKGGTHPGFAAAPAPALAGAAPSAAVDGPGVEELRRQVDALQRQQAQLMAELQRSGAERQHLFNEIQELRRERTSTDEEICESLREIFEWIGGSHSDVGQSNNHPPFVPHVHPHVNMNTHPTGPEAAQVPHRAAPLAAVAAPMPALDQQASAVPHFAPQLVPPASVRPPAPFIDAAAAPAAAPFASAASAMVVQPPLFPDSEPAVPVHQPPEVMNSPPVSPTNARVQQVATRPFEAPGLAHEMPSGFAQSQPQLPAAAAAPFATAPVAAAAPPFVSGAVQPPVQPPASVQPPLQPPASVQPPLQPPALTVRPPVQAPAPSIQPPAQQPLAAAPEWGAVPPSPAAEAQLSAPDTNGSAGGAFADVAGGGRPQPQEIKAAANPFGARPQQQPIQAAGNPFMNRPKQQPIQAKANPFGARPAQQQIQAASNPFGR